MSALVSMAMTLHWYAHAKPTIQFCNRNVVLQHDNMLLSDWIILHLMGQLQNRRRLECMVSKLKRVRRQYIVISA